MGITVPSPVSWTGSVYFGINANVNTQVSLAGRGSSQSTTQSGGAVCQGCVNVNTLTISSGSHSLENSRIGTASISGSFGIIRACTVGELSVSGSVSRICNSSSGNTDISGSMSNIVGLGTGNLSLSSSSCDITESSTSELSCSDTNLCAHKISASSCSVEGTSLAKIHNSSLDTLSISSSQSFLSNISCKTLSVGSGSSVDIKSCSALSVTNAGFITISCGSMLSLQNSGVVWGSLSNLGAISNSTVLFAYQSTCMGLGNGGVVKAWNTAGGILTWTPDGEGAVGNSTFDDFGWLPSDPPPGGGSSGGGGGGSGGGGGGGSGGGTSLGGGPVTQEDLATLNTALCGQISTLQNSVNSQVADLNGGIAASRLEYIAGLGVVREDMVTGLDGLEHTLTNGIDVVQQDLVDGLAEVGSTIQQVDTDFRTRIADARVEYVSPREIGLTTQTLGLVGAVWVNSELIVADDSVNVFNNCPVLDWNYRISEIVSSYLQPSTEYYIYLANHESPEFNIGALAVYDEHPSTYEWDFRGKLFLSTTPDIDGFFSNFGAGLNARIVGSLKTDSSPYNTYNDGYPTPDCGPFFLQEVDISWIAKKTSYPETYREFSDFSLFYKDQNTLELKLVDGLYGQIFVGGNLHVFNNNQQITINSFRLIWNATNITIDSKLIELDETDILPLTEYFIYVTNDLDIWNFNEINPNTQRPWQEFDSYAQLFYDSEYDLRKSLFLSTKEPEYGVMSQQWPGYCSRYIGSVSTDSYKYFIYNSTISAIRSLQLNPTYFDGLAEITLEYISTSKLMIIRRTGTSGIVMVGGIGVQTYDVNNPLAHTLTTEDPVYIYDETNVIAPLIDSGEKICQQVVNLIYVYLANNRPCWDNIGGLFCSYTPPTEGYLSSSYPGNTARWLATLGVVARGGNGELVTNGNFHDANDWNGLDSGWLWTSIDFNAYHLTTQLVNITIGQTLAASNWTTINNVAITQTSLGNVTESIVCHTISFDNGITWKVFKNNSWVSIVRDNSGIWQYSNAGVWANASVNSKTQALIQATDQTAYQWDKTDVEGMSIADWASLNGWSVIATSVKWDVRIVLGTSAPHGDYNTSQDNILPYMSVDTETINGVTYVASASSELANVYIAANTMHRDNNSSWWQTNTVPCPHWIQIDFGATNAKRVNKFQYWGYATVGPKRWKFEGSNNPSLGWTTLLDKTGADVPDYGHSWTPPFGFYNYTAYRYYRLYITASYHPTGVILLSELLFYESQSPVVVSSTFTKATFSVKNIESLSQKVMNVNANTIYQVAVTISSVSAGTVTPMIGNTLGVPIVAEGTNTQFIKSTNTDVLKLVPTADFDGYVDNVSCSESENAMFGDNCTVDTIAQRILTVDNDRYGTGILWDSVKILQVINNMVSGSLETTTFDYQKNSGLSVRLEYVDRYTIRLIPVINMDVQIVTPDMSTVTVPSIGIYKTVSGLANTRYYVYLTSTGTLTLSTTAPDKRYTSLETLGSSNIQVGDVCMTTPGAMTSFWNVCSSHNQQLQQESFTPKWVLGNLDYYFPVIAGFVVSNRASASFSKTGYITGYTGPISPNWTYTTLTGLGTITGTSNFLTYWGATFRAILTVSCFVNQTISTGIQNINATFSVVVKDHSVQVLNKNDESLNISQGNSWICGISSINGNLEIKRER